MRILKFEGGWDDLLAKNCFLQGNAAKNIWQKVNKSTKIRQR